MPAMIVLLETIITITVSIVCPDCLLDNHYLVSILAPEPLLSSPIISNAMRDETNEDINSIPQPIAT